MLSEGLNSGVYIILFVYLGGTLKMTFLRHQNTSLYN